MTPAAFRALRASALAACIVAANANANEEVAPAEYTAEIGIGAEYDSNVSVDEVDVASGQGDYALTMDLGLQAKKGLSQKVEVAATYDFSQSLYDEFSRVDRQTHILGTDLVVNSDSVDTAVSFYYINSLLDGDEFLELYRVSPSVSGFLAKKWFSRAAYVYADKTVEERPQRDADTNSGEFDLYYFRRGLRSYFNVGYRYKDEDAKADRLDYSSSSLKLRYIHRFDLFSRLAKLEFAWRYEDRNYSSITPSIGEDRDDQRHRWRADFEIPLSARAGVQLYYSYSDYESNYTPADYDQNLVGTRLFYTW